MAQFIRTRRSKCFGPDHQELTPKTTSQRKRNPMLAHCLQITGQRLRKVSRPWENQRNVLPWQRMDNSVISFFKILSESLGNELF